MGAATGVTNAAAQAAMGAGAAGTAVGVLSGKSLKASLTEGLKSAAVAGLVTGGQKGFSAQNPATPGQGPLTPDQVMKGEQAPVPDAVARTPAQIAEGVLPRGGETLNNQAAASLQAPAGAPPVNPDPLGDFIKTNKIGQDPSYFDRTTAYFDKNFFPSDRAAVGAQNAEVAAQGAYEKAIAAGKPEAMALRSYDNALKAATPGVISNYGPMVGAGLGITALAGGFKPKTVSPSGTVDMSGKATQDIINANPSRYITQGLPGVSYDASGNITGSTAGWNPRSGAGTTEVSSGYMPYSPSQYQPYNFMPRYAADGGYMQSSPAFPGTPLTSSRMPMPMGQQPAGILPMNTPGLPMNMSSAPMNLPVAGYAMGGAPVMGLASLGTGGYPRRNGQISGPGTETSDSIPAMLSDGEFVMTAKAVKALGKGNRRAGAKKMYALMHHLEKNAARG